MPSCLKPSQRKKLDRIAAEHDEKIIGAYPSAWRGKAMKPKRKDKRTWWARLLGWLG